MYEYRRRIFAGDIAAGENKSACLRLCQRKPFQLPVADALVAREHNPTSTACVGEPRFVGSAFEEVIGQTLYVRAGCTQRFHHRQAVERLVNEQDE